MPIFTSPNIGKEILKIHTKKISLNIQTIKNDGLLSIHRN